MGRAATAVVHDDVTIYILVLNETLLFGKWMDQSLINPNQIRSFSIPVSKNLFYRTREFGIDHKEIFITFKTEGTTVLFENYVPSDHELENCAHIFLADGKVK